MTLNFLIDSNTPIPVPDIQRTTFSADAVARFAGNTFEEATTNPNFDVVVVGSGMYGGYAATKLFSIADRLQSEGALNAADRPRVLILESGPFLITEHVQNLTRMFGIENAVLNPLVDPGQSNTGFNPHHRCVGGKSLFWGGWSPRLTNEDLALWPQEVRDYLETPAPQADGYQFVLQETGATPTTEFINGRLFEALLARAQTIVSGTAVPTLDVAEEAPIAVLGSPPNSGLFSLDKFSSLPLLLDSIRDDNEETGSDNAQRRLFLVPNAEVIQLVTQQGFVRQVVIALTELSKNTGAPTRSRRIVRLDLKDGAMVVLAGNTVNSTRLALNSFRRPATLGAELIGRNLMAHVRGNYFWRIRRSLLDRPGQPPLTDELRTAAINIRGRTGPLANVPPIDVTPPGGRRGHFHMQTYAAGNLNIPSFPGAAFDAEQYLYRMVPNLEDVQAIVDSQQNEWVTIQFRTCGETFGDRNTTPIGSNPGVSWISVNPFGGAGDDVFVDSLGQQIRVPKAFVNLVETTPDQAVRQAQTDAMDRFLSALTGVALSTIQQRQNQAGTLEFLRGGEDGIGTTYHESGTMWMGAEASNSVTDVNGRFHHVANACCVDQSLFPTVGSSNPVPTGLALSRMVVRHLLSRFIDTPDVPVPSAFQQIYNGTLQNWQIAGAGVGPDRFTPLTVGSSQILEAGEDGPGPLGILFFTGQQFGDFELQLDWKAFTITANSGVFLRMPQPPAILDDAFYDSVFEVQIDDRGFDPDNNVFGSPLHKTGAVYKVVPARQWAAKAVVPRFAARPGFWNHYEIRLQGRDISVRLNGRLVSEGQLPVGSRASGFIGLQCHTDVVQFRNIGIRAL